MIHSIALRQVYARGKHWVGHHLRGTFEHWFGHCARKKSLATACRRFLRNGTSGTYIYLSGSRTVGTTFWRGKRTIIVVSPTGLHLETELFFSMPTTSRRWRRPRLLSQARKA